MTVYPLLDNINQTSSQLSNCILLRWQLIQLTVVAIQLAKSNGVHWYTQWDIKYDKKMKLITWKSIHYKVLSMGKVRASEMYYWPSTLALAILHFKTIERWSLIMMMMENVNNILNRIFIGNKYVARNVTFSTFHSILPRVFCQILLLVIVNQIVVRFVVDEEWVLAFTINFISQVAYNKSEQKKECKGLLFVWCESCWYFFCCFWLSSLTKGVLV